MKGIKQIYKISKRVMKIFFFFIAIYNRKSCTFDPLHLAWISEVAGHLVRASFSSGNILAGSQLFQSV